MNIEIEYEHLENLESNDMILSKSVSHQSVMISSSNQKKATIFFNDELKSKMRPLQLEIDKCNIINSYRRKVISDRSPPKLKNDVIPYLNNIRKMQQREYDGSLFTQTNVIDKVQIYSDNIDNDVKEKESKEFYDTMFKQRAAIKNNYLNKKFTSSQQVKISPYLMEEHIPKLSNDSIPRSCFDRDMNYKNKTQNKDKSIKNSTNSSKSFSKILHETDISGNSGNITKNETTLRSTMTGLDPNKKYKPSASKSTYNATFKQTTMEKWDKHANTLKTGATNFKCGKYRNNKHHAVRNDGMFYVAGLNNNWEPEKAEELEYLQKYKDMINDNKKLDDEQQKHFDYISKKHKIDVDMVYEDIEEEDENYYYVGDWVYKYRFSGSNQYRNKLHATLCNRIKNDTLSEKPKLPRYEGQLAYTRELKTKVEEWKKTRPPTNQIKKDKEMEDYDNEMLALKYKMKEKKRETDILEAEYHKNKTNISFVDLSAENNPKINYKINKEKRKNRDVTNLDGLGFLRDYENQQNEEAKQEGDENMEEAENAQGNENTEENKNDQDNQKTKEEGNENNGNASEYNIKDIKNNEEIDGQHEKGEIEININVSDVKEDDLKIDNNQDKIDDISAIDIVKNVDISNVSNELDFEENVENVDIGDETN